MIETNAKNKSGEKPQNSTEIARRYGKKRLLKLLDFSQRLKALEIYKKWISEKEFLTGPASDAAIAQIYPALPSVNNPVQIHTNA